MASPAHTHSVTAAQRTPQRRTTSCVSGYPQALSPRTMAPITRFISPPLRLHTVTAASLSAEVRPVEDVRDVEPYDAVVLGGAAYMFHWLKPAVTFARRHRKELAVRPVWLFSSGPLGTDPVDKDGKNVLETSRPKEFGELTKLCTCWVSRSYSAPTTRTRRPPVSAGGSSSTCLPRGPPCQPVTSVTGHRRLGSADRRGAGGR